MMGEENVNEGRAQTENFAEASVGNKVSAVLGKFKDVDALVNAYEALEAEFTRRSQKLRRLEREVENSQKAGESGAEKLRKTAQERRRRAKKFDAFVAEVDGVAVDGEPTEGLEEGVDTPEEGALEKIASEEGAASVLREREKAFSEDGVGAGEETPKEEANGEEVPRGRWTQNTLRPKQTIEREAVLTDTGEDKATFEELFQKAFSNEEVRLRIVGEYLSSLGKVGAPLTGGGTGVLAAPPKRAATVTQAGDMALRYFRKPTE